ncbi:MAG TPA: AbrB/MazE/SpoVT family DNA-binding domain-containing protein [Fibrobacteria bacterium]|nr:AbrB/MazE/SpoVT family DNA-binding domain-containing protein [Fibrobacteria bacterium]
MVTSTISPKFQVVIPKEIREKMGLKAGTKVQVLQYEDRIEFIPLKPMKSLRGFLKDIHPDFDREKDRL